MSTRQKWGYGSFAVGLVLAIVFFAAFAASSGEGLKSALLSAAMVCVVAGTNGLAVGISDKVSVGKWTGLVVGALGFAVWGIAWLAGQNTPFGWAAIFSAIAGLASLFPAIFGGSSAPRS